MAEVLRKKIRKFFRKQQRKNFWLGLKGDEYQLAKNLPLDSYRDFERELTNGEIYEFKSILSALGCEKKLLTIIPADVWFSRCCADLQLFNSFSDQALEKILNDSNRNISEIFLYETEYQLRIMQLLNEERLSYWIISLKGARELYTFLNWLSTRNDPTADMIFQKLASVYNSAVAILLRNLESEPKKRILDCIFSEERELLPIYQEVDKDELFRVWKEIDSWYNTDTKLYFWLYTVLPVQDKDEFLNYLFENKRDKLCSWDEKICAEMYRSMDLEDVRAEFVAELFHEQEAEQFELFYEELSLEEKERMFDDLLGYEEGEKVIGEFLNRKEEEELGLLEYLLKEKYVTQK